VLGAARPGGQRLSRAHAAAAYADPVPAVAGLWTGGLSLRAIACRLTTEGHTTRRGAAWNPVRVRRVPKRVGEAGAGRRRPPAGDVTGRRPAGDQKAGSSGREKGPVREIFCIR